MWLRWLFLESNGTVCENVVEEAGELVFKYLISSIVVVTFNF